MRSDLIFFVLVGIVLTVGYVISKRPRHFLLALALISIPWQGGLWIPFIMVDFRLVYIVIILIFIHIQISGSKLKKKERFYAPIAYPAIAIIIWALLSTFIKAYNINYGMKGVFIFSMNLLLFYCVINTIKTPEDVEFILKWYLIGLLFQSTVAALQFTDVIFKVPIIGEERAGEMYWRKSGTFIHPNQCGMYHMIMLPLALRMIIGAVIGKNTKKIILYSTIFLAGILGIFTTFNRGSWVGLAFGIIVMFGYHSFRKGNKKLKRVLLGICVAGVFVLGVFFVKYGDPLTDRLFGSDVQGIRQGRGELQDASYNVIKANPVFGVAPWNYQFHMTTVIFVHNLYLLLAAENGIIGLLFFLWFILNYLREILKGMKSKFLFISNLNYGLFASLCGFLLASYPGPDYFTSHAVGLNIWALAGLAVVLTRLDRRIMVVLKRRKLETRKEDQSINQNILKQKDVNLNIPSL
jgi:O-antigen ligase